jgi:hypothetical protein
MNERRRKKRMEWSKLPTLTFAVAGAAALAAAPSALACEDCYEGLDGNQICWSGVGGFYQSCYLVIDDYGYDVCSVYGSCSLDPYQGYDPYETDYCNWNPDDCFLYDENDYCSYYWWDFDCYFGAE